MTDVENESLGGRTQGGTRLPRSHSAVPIIIDASMIDDLPHARINRKFHAHPRPERKDESQVHNSYRARRRLLLMIPRLNSSSTNGHPFPPRDRTLSVTLDQLTRIFPATKFCPAPLTLGRVSSESHFSVIHSNGRTPTRVLLGDMLAAMSANWTDTASFGVGAECILFSASELPSAPFPRFTARVRGQPGIADALARAHRDTHVLPHAVPHLSPDVSHIPTPQSASREPFVWSSMEPEPEPTRSSAAESPSKLKAFARQQSTRGRRSGNTKTVGDKSIDRRVVPPGVVRRYLDMHRANLLGTTQTSTSAAAVRSSVVIEHQEESPRDGQPTIRPCNALARWHHFERGVPSTVEKHVVKEVSIEITGEK
ncbi:hypothetical protein DFH94DRAFT_846111 [Russula ochroleuca]|uniref:Uncharacterized protein n=1 Tax=Russula ochroleuca TaxID=152965 RepID=A0A9P5MSJ3_9AGAM|nr:hypothetical protein DFH94DRAFT_846111 [Russula ochroleuca]